MDRTCIIVYNILWGQSRRRVCSRTRKKKKTVEGDCNTMYLGFSRPEYLDISLNYFCSKYKTADETPKVPSG